MCEWATGNRRLVKASISLLMLFWQFCLSFFPMNSATSLSFQKAAWKRLLKNKGAMFGLVVIVLAILVAIFAYFIAPDSSPNANRIILEIGGNKPGYSQDFIRVKKER